MSIKRFYSILVNTLWGFLIFLLPITSFPILSKLVGDSVVAPPSVVLAFLLIIVWFIPYVVQKGSLPREALPFLVFIFVALIASAGSFFIDTPSYKTNSFLRERIEGILTLLVAVAIYFLASTWHKSTQQVKTTIKIINLSGIFLVAWSFMQIYFIYFNNGNYPSITAYFQRMISIRDLSTVRILGFAYEPSWLAHQLNAIYIPIWLGLTIAKTSVYKIRISIFTLENFLLALGLVLVALSSRIGVMSMLLILGYLVIRFSLFFSNQLCAVIFNRLSIPQKSINRIPIQLAMWTTLIGISVLIFGKGSLILIKILGRIDWRLERVFSGLSINLLISNPYIFFNILTFAERFVYWVAGWRVFAQYPLLGVGLGNAGFFFARELPSYAWSLPEVMDVYYRSPLVPNIKSLWIRLLAETGIIGFAAFISWFYVLWRSSRLSERSTDPIIKAIGWMGQFVLIGFLAEGFSLDTFALPYLWLSLGILSATSAIYRKKLSDQEFDSSRKIKKRVYPHKQNARP